VPSSLLRSSSPSADSVPPSKSAFTLFTKIPLGLPILPHLISILLRLSSYPSCMISSLSDRSSACSSTPPLCYDPGPYHQFSLIFCHFISRSQSLTPHSFPHAPLGPPPNHLTSHLMDHLTIPQSTITCHHSAVRSTPQYHHSTYYELPAHCHVMIDLTKYFHISL